MEVIVFVLALAAVGAGVWISYRLKQQRRAGMASFALQFGLEFSAEDPFGLLTHPFALFRKGDGRGIENVLWGEWQGLPVKAADYWYYEESTDSKGHRSRSYRRFSVAIAEVAVFLPHVTIERENVLTRLADRIGFADIPFESERFNRAFQVKASDRPFAYRLVDARMMRWLLEAEGRFGFEVFGQEVLVFGPRLKPTGLVPLLGTAKAFVDHVPRLVWNEYGVPAKPDPNERS